MQLYVHRDHSETEEWKHGLEREVAEEDSLFKAKHYNSQVGRGTRSWDAHLLKQKPSVFILSLVYLRRKADVYWNSFIQF